MDILVTGGAGFIGSNLCRALVSSGHRVSVVDDLSLGSRANLSALEVEFIRGCVRDRHLIPKLVAGKDAVVHLAALGSVPRSLENPTASIEANLDGMRNVLEAVRLHQVKMVWSSSSSVYGSNTNSPKSEDEWTAPMSPYAASKLAAEALASAYVTSFGLDITTFRFFNVYGPLQKHDHVYAAVIPKWIHRLTNGLPLEIFGDGEQIRDFTFVDDVVAILVSALGRDIGRSRPINLAFGRPLSLNQLLEYVQEVVGKEAILEYLQPRPGDVHSSCNDPALLTATFPEAEVTSIQEGLSKTVSWMKSYGGSSSMERH